VVAHTLLHIIEGHDEVDLIEIAGGGPLPQIGERISVRGERYQVDEVVHKFGDDSLITEAYVELYVKPVADVNKLTPHDPDWLDEKLSRSDI
jgi:hypothetical protein